MVYYFSLLMLTLCIVLFTFNSKINRSILYLLGFLIPVAIYGIFHHLVFFNNSAFKLAFINVQSLPLYYLAAPMIYFYVRGTLKDDHRLSKKDFFHFLPAIIGLVSVLPYLFKSFEYKVAIAQQFIDDPNSIKTIQAHWFYPNYVNVLARPLQLLSYSVACLVMIWQYTRKNRSYSPILQKKILVKWLIAISALTLLISLSYLLMTYKFFMTTDIKKEVFNQIPISLFTGFAYAMLPVMIIIFPDILYGIPRASVVKTEGEEKNKQKIDAIEEVINPKDPFSETAVQILNYMKKEQHFLNPKFCLNDIMEDLQLPKHHVHYCFNHIIKHKFATLKNEYRITYSKKLLLAGKTSLMTIEGIGFESGFTSKSHFFAVFKAVTGVSPNEYMAQQKVVEKFSTQPSS